MNGRLPEFIGMMSYDACPTCRAVRTENKKVRCNGHQVGVGTEIQHYIAIACVFTSHSHCNRFRKKLQVSFDINFVEKYTLFSNICTICGGRRGGETLSVDFLRIFLCFRLANPKKCAIIY